MWSYQLVYQQLKLSLGAYLFRLVSIGLISLWKKFQSDKQNWWKSLNKGYSTKILMNNDQNRVSTVVKGKLTVSKTTSLENNQTWYGLVSTVETPRLSTNSFFATGVSPFLTNSSLHENNYVLRLGWVKKLMLKKFSKIKSIYWT